MWALFFLYLQEVKMRIKVNKIKTIKIRVDSTEYYVFKSLAESKNTTISNVVRELVKEEYMRICRHK